MPPPTLYVPAPRSMARIVALTTSSTYGPAPRLMAVTKEIERRTGCQRERHLRERHVRALSRPERVEVAQDDGVELEAAGIRPREVLARELRDAVGDTGAGGVSSGVG